MEEKLKTEIEKNAKLYAHNYFDMHETNSYQELKRGFESGAEWAIKESLKDNNIKHNLVLKFIKKLDSSYIYDSTNERRSIIKELNEIAGINH